MANWERDMPTEQLIPREHLLKRMSISDSTERRKRQSGTNWPAHVVVGSRILYSERSVSKWIADQEAAASERNAPSGLGSAVEAPVGGEVR